MWARDHQIRQAAGAAGDVAGKMITGGLSVVGDVCSFTNTTDQSGISLCLDADGGRIVYNGVGYPIGGGGGNVVGPNTSVINHVAVFNNTSGTLLADTTSLALTQLTVTPAAGVTQALKSTSNMTGTVAADTWYNQTLIQSDNVAGAGRNMFGGGVYHVCCGSSAQGYRFALSGRLDVTTAWSAADPEAAFGAVVGNARASVTAPSVGALLMGVNANVDLYNNAQDWGSVIGVGIDMTVRAGTEIPQVKTGLKIGQAPLDAVQGAIDAAIHVAGAGTAPGWLNLILIDSLFGAQPISVTNGSIIGTRGAITLYQGFDFSAVTFTGNIMTGTAGNMHISREGNIFTSKQLYGFGDLGAASYPTSTAGAGWARTSNFSGVAGEIVDWNTREANITGISFQWKQKSGAAAASDLMQLNGRANVIATTVLQIRANNTASGEALLPVTLGAADSGGAGFRALRVVN